jgi:hypothetical protein
VGRVEGGGKVCIRIGVIVKGVIVIVVELVKYVVILTDTSYTSYKSSIVTSS